MRVCIYIYIYKSQEAHRCSVRRKVCDRSWNIRIATGNLRRIFPRSSCSPPKESLRFLWERGKNYAEITTRLVIIVAIMRLLPILNWFADYLRSILAPPTYQLTGCFDDCSPVLGYTRPGNRWSTNCRLLVLLVTESTVDSSWNAEKNPENSRGH